MRFFFPCEKNYAILKSSKAVYSPQNSFLRFFSVTAKRDFPRSLSSKEAHSRSHHKNLFGKPDHQIPDLIGSISGGDLLAVQGPCTHRWSPAWRTSRNDAGLLCLGCFVLSPWLFNSFFISLSTGKRMPGFLFSRVSWMTDNLDLPLCLCQVTISLPALLLCWTENAAAPAMGPEASELSDSVTAHGTLDHWFYPH